MVFEDAPQILRDFLTYHEAIQGHSKRTVNEYYLDLRNFFRFIKQEKKLVASNVPYDQIPVDDVDLTLVRSVTLSDVYSYMNYLGRERAKHPNSKYTEFGLTPAARARKIASIRSFYKYLTNKAKLLNENPMQDLDTPRLKKSLPRYLSLDESIQLLSGVDTGCAEVSHTVHILGRVQPVADLVFPFLQMLRERTEQQHTMDGCICIHPLNGLQQFLGRSLRRQHKFCNRDVNL